VDFDEDEEDEEWFCGGCSGEKKAKAKKVVGNKRGKK